MNTQRYWSYENKKKLFEAYLDLQTLAAAGQRFGIGHGRASQVLGEFVKQLSLSWVRSAYHLKVAESRDIRVVNCFEILGGHKTNWLMNGEFLLSVIRKIELSSDTTGAPLLEDTYAKGRAVSYVNQPRAH